LQNEFRVPRRSRWPQLAARQRPPEHPRGRAGEGPRPHPRPSRSAVPAALREGQQRGNASL